MEPARWFFAKHEDEPTTEVAIRRAPGEDLYVVLGVIRRGDAERHLRDHRQSARQLDLVRLRGDGARHRPRAAARDARSRLRRRRSRPAPRRRRCCCCCCCCPRRLRAQHVENLAGGRPRERSSRRQLEARSSACAAAVRPQRIGDAQLLRAREPDARRCGSTCARARTASRSSPHSSQEYGSQESCPSPIDKGFNRLAWFFPYLIGATGAASVAFVAFRWSRRDDAADAASAAARPREDPHLRRGWTMSSATSIDADAERPPERAAESQAADRRRRRARRRRGLPALAFLRARVAGRVDGRRHDVAAGLARASHPHQPHDRRRRRGGRRLLPDARATRGARRDAAQRASVRARARGARARKGAGAAIDQGARVRSRHGEGVARRTSTRWRAGCARAR